MRKKLLFCCSILFVALFGSTVALAATQSCVTDDGRAGTSTDGGPCVPTEAGPPSSPNNPNGSSEFKALAPIPGLTAPNPGEGSVIDSDNLANFFNNLYKYLIGIAAILAVIQIIRGGLEISTQDSISKQSAGREHIRDAIFGLVLVLSPVLVFSIINPTILNLSLNLDELKTVDSPPDPDNDTDNPDLSQFECTTLRSGTYLETASCPAKALANAYVCKNTSLTLRLSAVDLPCRNYDPNTNTCVDRVLAECIMQPPLKLIYYYTEDIGWIYNSQNAPAKIIPRDADKETEFITGCASDGGAFQKLRRETVTCPSDARIPPYDPLEVSGVVCQMFELNCRSKGL